MIECCSSQKSSFAGELALHPVIRNIDQQQEVGSKSLIPRFKAISLVLGVPSEVERGHSEQIPCHDSCHRFIPFETIDESVGKLLTAAVILMGG